MFLVRRRRLHIEVLRAESVTSSLNDNDGLRLLILGCLDLFLSLPMAAFTLAFQIWDAVELGSTFTFYHGWGRLHKGWGPWAGKLVLDDRIGLIRDYIPVISTVLVGFALFVLFGCAAQARAMYTRDVVRVVPLVFTPCLPPLQSSTNYMSSIKSKVSERVVNALFGPDAFWGALRLW